ncbi:MAG: DUF47 family protein [Candidatus Micrarchaeota archaeon]|nr:DUF47 family protein [Candidatus Micrarchaeota archaeon]
MPLMKLKHLLVPQDGAFFELMQKQAEIAHVASQALSEILGGNCQDTHKKSKEIRDLEHQGDQLMRELYTALNKTFIVPIDHSEIATLASALDDILDLIDQVSTLLDVYEVSIPSPAMKHLSELLVDQTNELKNAVIAINHLKTYGKVIHHCTKIKQLENKADEIHIQAIGVLFKKNEAIEVIKQKEILDCLESATDKVDKASQHISDIVMKHS